MLSRSKQVNNTVARVLNYTCHPQKSNAKKRRTSLPDASFASRMPSKSKQKRDVEKCRTSPLDAFFARYPDFDYDITESASHEFYRMCDKFGWEEHHPRRASAKQDFRDALVQQFNKIYGTDENYLAGWQNLCFIVHIDPIPDNLDACREAVRGTHVNLVDLVDAGRTGKDVKIFDTELELSEYTCYLRRFFPKENAYAGGLLRYLLRHIFHPAVSQHSPRGGRRRR